MKQDEGQLFQIELDALQKIPQQFRDLILNSVNKYYDQGIREMNLKEFAPIAGYVKKKVKLLYD